MARIGTAIIVLLVIATGVYFGRGALGRSSKPASSAGSPVAVHSAASSGNGTLVEGDIGAPGTLNPLLASTQTERDLSKLIFSGLVRIDGSGTPQPDLAETWKISDDGRTYTFALRPGVTWQDGKPFTSQDVRFTIGLIQSPDFPGDQNLARFWKPIVVDTPDDSTVVFHLLEPFAPFVNNLGFPVVPKHILGGVVGEDLASDPFGAKPVGTGPFQFVSWDANHNQIELKAFDGYAEQGPLLKKLTFKYFDNSDSLLSALKNGDVDASGTIAADSLLRAGALPKGDIIYAPATMSYTALFFNTRVAPFTDLKVRQAIQAAVDPSELTNGPLQARAVAGASPIPMSSWAHSSQDVTYDPAQAASLLKEDGWVDDEQAAVLTKDGARLGFQVLVSPDDSARVLMAQTIAQQLAKIHIQVDVQIASADAVNQALSTHQFQAVIYGGHFGNGDPDCFDVWSSDSSSAALNVTGVSDSAIDKLLRDARSTPDPNARRSLYAQFQQEFVKQAPAVVLYYPRYLFVVSDRVTGVKPDSVVNPSDRFQQITSWKISSGGTAQSMP